MEQNMFGDKVNYSRLPAPFVLISLLNRFDNRYQSAADAVFPELSWKQVFFLNGVALFKTPPTIRDMADFMGCSHQNANKLYSKLLESGYIVSEQDVYDRRKQRITLTEKGTVYLSENRMAPAESIHRIFDSLAPEELDNTICSIYKLIRQLEDNHR